MKKIVGLALLAGALGALSGCSNVTSGMPGMTPATGEAWYSKDSGIGMLIFSSKIYYCSKDNPGKCQQAEFVEGEAGPAIPK
ncbi:MAG: hypothetical protein R3B70_38440 [Polyangiaceae bacterium]